MARTAVVAGTATAVSGSVANKQAQKAAAQQAQQQPPAQQYAPPAAEAPAAPASGGISDDALERLQKLSELHAAGALTDEEFAAAKAKILGL